MYCFKTHEPHQTSDSFGVHPIALPPKPCRHPWNTVKRLPGVLFINQPHQEQVQFALRTQSIIVGAPGKAQQFALLVNRDL